MLTCFSRGVQSQHKQLFSEIDREYMHIKNNASKNKEIGQCVSEVRHPNWIFSWAAAWQCFLALIKRMSQPGNL